MVGCPWSMVDRQDLKTAASAKENKGIKIKVGII
jgi:hypothetical protein